MKSSISATGPSPSVAPPTRSITVILADGSRLRVTCRDLAAQLRQERSATLKRLRQARIEAKAEVADRIGEARIRRELEAGEREMDAAIRQLSKQVRVKPEPRRSTSPARLPRPWPIGTGHSGITVTRSTTSALARRDRLGREGIMLRIRYVRAGGKHAGPGCLRRHWRYIAREAAVTLDSEGHQIVLSNLGDDIDAVADALGLQEQVLREMRKNAKLGFRMVGAFPYGLPVDARREVLQRLGDELFGARDLPWSAAAHDADPDAQVDNPHFHLDYGLLPMARQADGSFIVSNDLRTDLDGQEGLRFIRHTVARVMTEVAQEYGLDRTFTALSYRERGMDREGGEHVGQEGTAAHRRGEHVAAIARNGAKERLATARERAKRARERFEALERLKRAITVIETAPVLDAAPVDADIRATAALATAPSMVGVIALTDTLTARQAPSITSTSMGPVPAMTPAEEAPRVGDISGSDAVRLVEAPSLPSPPADRNISAAVPRTARLPAMSDAGDPGPVTRAVPPIAFSAPAPSLSPTPLVTTVSPAIDEKSTPITVMPPAIVTVAREAERMDAPPIGHVMGSDASDIPVSVTLAAIGGSPPHIIVCDLPHTHTHLAPVIDAVPALTAPTLGETPMLETPPDISRVGSAAPRLTEVPLLWGIGREPSDDAADRDTVRRVELLLEEEEARRRAGVSAQSNVNAVHAAAFEALRVRDEWLQQDERGRYTVSDDALRATGLSCADLDAPAAQAALEAIGSDQIDRLGPVLDDMSGRAAFHVNGEALRLDDRFGARLRADVARWSGDRHFRAFVGRVWPRLKPALDAHPAPTSHPSKAAASGRDAALATLLTAIAEERHLLAKDHGVPVVDPVLLERFGLAPADLAGDDVRKRLVGIAEHQTIEVSQIAAHVQRAPQHIVADGEGWLLDEAAPAEIRTLVAAWRNDAAMQRALGRTAALPSGDMPSGATPVRDPASPSPKVPGDAWRRARASREAAMAESDAIERLDETGLAQPGRRIERPGATRSGAAVPIARRFRGLSDPGIGG